MPVWSEWPSKNSNFSKIKNISSKIIYGKFTKVVPEYSILIITYKRSDGLKKALESALNQTTEKSYEIIVLDDSGFDDATDKLMKEYCGRYNNIIYYRNEVNLGQYNNWNRACELCRTEWYCLLHDDDMMKPDYLKEMIAISNTYGRNAGLIGCYLDEIDIRNSNKKPINYFVNAFIKMRRKKPIFLTLNDNLKNIFTLSCCLFINKYKAMELGGLNDNYYPSSDFVFSAKMNKYYSTIFYPNILCYRGVGENESLKKSVCDGSIICAYNLSLQLARDKGYSEKTVKRKASVAAVIAEIGVKGYNNIDYGEVKRGLGMKDIYNKRFVIFLINLYSKLNWGLLLFRR